MEPTNDKVEKNSVKYLQSNNFIALSLQEQLEIKLLGRPTPELDISQSSSSRNHAFIRRFNQETYYKNRWLCGCNETNALFCFPCLLYGGETSWTQTGTTDLKHLGGKIKKHELSLKHLRNVMNLGMLGKADLVELHLNEGYREEVKQQNENVKKNREILSKIIDCIRFIGKYELPIVGHDEDIIKGLLEFAGKLDESLRNHFMNSPVFREISVNDLLDCILEVCQEEIRLEIAQSNFLAIISENCSNLSEKIDQMVLFRYVLNERVYERFWGFYKLKNQSSECLAECIKNQLNIVLEGDTEKLIAQSYDGYAMIRGLQNDVHHLIRQTYPHALLIHHYDHKFNSVVEKVSSQHQRIRSFFFSLNSIVNFFTASDSRLDTLDCISKRYHQEVNILSHNEDSTVNKVFQCRLVIKECLEVLQQNTDMNTVREATALVHILNDEDFNFWLEFFNDIMPLTEILDNQLYSNNLKEPNDIHNSLEEFTSILQSERNRLLTAMPEEIIPNPVKKRKLTVENIAAAKESTDNIVCHAEERLSFIKYLTAEKLFHPSLFNVRSAGRLPFPLDDVEHTMQAYPFLYKERLVPELSVLYERPEFTDIRGVLKMYDILYNTGICEYFIDVTKLMKIVLTTPMITLETDRYFNTLDKVKSFIKNNKSDENLLAMAMLSLEHVMIEKIINFNERVIDKFADRDGRSSDFKYQ